MSIGDGIARIKGLPSAAMEEILNFEDGSRAVVFALEPDIISAILLAQDEKLTAGASCLSVRPAFQHSRGRRAARSGDRSSWCSPRRWHRRRNAPVAASWKRLSPPIIQREFVNEPLYTGNKIVDTLIPIGKGQRQLLIGDNGLGEERFGHRHGHQPKRQERSVRLRFDRPKALIGGEYHRDPARDGRTWTHHDRRG